MSSILQKNPSPDAVLRHTMGEHLTMKHDLQELSMSAVQRVLGEDSLERKDVADVRAKQLQMRRFEQLLQNMTHKGSDPGRVTMIGAMDPNGLMGNGSRLPWKRYATPGELRHFRNTTLGSIVVAGRTTAESIGGKLSGRLVFVVTSQHLPKREYPFQFGSYKEAVSVALRLVPNVFLIGGRSCYEWGCTFANAAILSILDKEYEGDVYWPLQGTTVKLEGRERWLPLSSDWDLKEEKREEGENFSVLYFDRKWSLGSLS